MALPSSTQSSGRARQTVLGWLDLSWPSKAGPTAVAAGLQAPPAPAPSTEASSVSSRSSRAPGQRSQDLPTGPGADP